MAVASTRRTVLKRLGATTAVVWAAPAITTISHAAATGSEICTDPQICFLTCEKLRKLWYVTDQYLQNCATQYGNAGYFANLQALARQFFDDALFHLGCCPIVAP